MKKLALIVIVLTLGVGFIFVNHVNATPLTGIHIEVCKYGLFSRLFGNCFEYEVDASYEVSSIWCYSSNTIKDGWTCVDNNANSFDILYRAIDVKNINSKTIEIVRHRIEYGRNWTYTDTVESGKTGFIFHEEDYAFSIRFEESN